jgi:uncharacterized protein
MDAVEDNSVETESKKVVLEYVRRFNTGDIGYAHELLADDLVWWVNGDLPFSGSISKPVFRKNNEMLVNLFKTFPAWILDSLVAEGNQVAAVMHSLGETNGGFEYRNAYHILFTVENGRITRAAEYMDTKHCYDLLDAIETEQSLKHASE